MTEQATTETSNTRIPLSQIDPVVFGNYRSKRNPVKFDELKKSIQKRGVLQSVLLRPAGDRFELVAGFGRFNGSVELGLHDIPALIKPMSDAEAMEAQIEENLNREDLSLIDECKAVQQLSAFYNGDRQAIADRLCWPMRKVNERIEILKCCEEVLNAVTEGTITVGHALLLAPFSTKLQQGTLKKIVSEKWTVSYLRQRASKGQQYLSFAKFDTNECNTCSHNSAAQSGLFGLDDHKAACSNLNCFKEKTARWLETRTAELEDEYGTVLLIQQIDEADRNTVDAISVGEDQFNTGCQACDKRVILIDDRLGRVTGTTYQNQCIDKLCFNRCVAAFNPPIVEDERATDSLDVEITTVSNDVVSTKRSADKTNQKKKQTVSCQIPKKVIETNKAMLRQVSAELLLPQEQFHLALSYAALRRTASGYKPSNNHFDSASTFDTNLSKALSADSAELKTEIASVIAFLAKEDSNSGLDFTQMMIKNITHSEHARAAAIAKWTPTKEILNEYTVGSLTALCIKAGFDKAMEGKETNSFKKASSAGKGKFIETILKTEFDWRGFAPDEYIKLIK
ncbi:MULTISPECIES: PRTRC system ParB family protein [Shewanella]|uniref:PRTRC system ParB family protein n=1 Tax=Shewanella TaxID=22 RepID=UPI000B3453CC|nr:PRTRC system ParB family protein [Shewanella putrefaciens]